VGALLPPWPSRALALARVRARVTHACGVPKPSSRQACGQPAGTPGASRVLEQRRSDLELLVTYRISLEGLPGVCDQLRARRAIKVEVEPRV
jgi:hypothetical protein